ncbi:hypothetical protein QC762_102985 [Podospora pseudocomata]|uniref:Uncharacterized protein n=1 Tax=Podospora pseudocomata TaxID=2093779 RepID=A0ABR0GS70_9PEZI|nr:hypothetical protein QC762_102985 [Podospora pseudocomata]
MSAICAGGYNIQGLPCGVVHFDSGMDGDDDMGQNPTWCLWSCQSCLDEAIWQTRSPWTLNPTTNHEDG